MTIFREMFRILADEYIVRRDGRRIRHLREAQYNKER